MRPAFNSTSEHPLPLDPQNKLFTGALKKGSGVDSKKSSGAALKKSSGATPQTPVLPKDLVPASQRDKKKVLFEVPTRKISATDKQKGVQPDLSQERKRKAPSSGEASIQEPSNKKLHKERETAFVVTRTPTSTPSTTRSTPNPKATLSVPASSLPPSEYLSKTSDELREEYRKCLQEIIPDPEKGVGVVWKTHLPKDYPDGLGVYFPGYTNMQHNLTPSVAECVKYTREAFCMTSTAEEQKLVKEDPLEALGLILHYQHHSGVITGALWDKYEKEALRLEAPPPGVSESSATVLERDFFKEQMLICNRLANIRLEEISAGKREVENLKDTMQKQHTLLIKKEVEFKEALAKVAGIEKEMAERDR